MSIRIKCDRCKRELNETGGILITPPDKKNRVKKKHICRECCEELDNYMKKGAT